MTDRITDIGPEDFVRAWEAAHSIVEVATLLGYTGLVSRLSLRATYYRRRGVNLKRFTPRSSIGGSRLNIDDLNDLIDEERSK